MFYSMCTQLEGAKGRSYSPLRCKTGGGGGSKLQTKKKKKKKDLGGGGGGAGVKQITNRVK